jgi:hypothetical protein
MSPAKTAEHRKCKGIFNEIQSGVNKAAKPVDPNPRETLKSPQDFRRG